MRRKLLLKPKSSDGHPLMTWLPLEFEAVVKRNLSSCLQRPGRNATRFLVFSVH